MSRPTGATTDPDAGRSPGRKPTFGHRKAIDQYRAGQAFTGDLAVAKEQEIRRRWLEDGILAIMEDNTVRLQTCLELYESCVLAKIDAKDAKTLPRALKDYARLVQRANQELDRIREIAAEKGAGAIDYETILQEQENYGDNSNPNQEL